MKTTKTFSLKKVFKDYFDSLNAFTVIVPMLTAFVLFIINGGTRLIECILHENITLNQIVKDYGFPYALIEPLQSGLAAAAGSMLITLAFFSFLHGKASCKQYLSFGCRKKSIFTKFYGYSLITSGIAVFFGSLSAVIIASEYPDGANYIVLFTLNMARYMLLGTTIGTAGALICGKTYEAALSAMAFASLPAALLYACRVIFNGVLYGYAGGITRETLFEPLESQYPLDIRFVIATNSYNATGFWKCDLYQLMWIALFIIAAVLLKKYFTNRFDGTRAGIAGKSKLAIIAICSAVSLAAFIFVSEFTSWTSDFIIVIILTVIISAALAVALSAQKRSLKTCLLPALTAPAVLAVVIIGSVLASPSYAHRTPDFEKITEVNVQSDIIHLAFDEGTVIYDGTLHLETPEDIQTVIQCQKSLNNKYDRDYDGEYRYLYINYYLTDGTRFSRQFYRLGGKNIETINALLETDAANEREKLSEE